MVQLDPESFCELVWVNGISIGGAQTIPDLWGGMMILTELRLDECHAC